MFGSAIISLMSDITAVRVTAESAPTGAYDPVNESSALIRRLATREEQLASSPILDQVSGEVIEFK